MPYCKPCDIHYASSHDTCVLCQQTLESHPHGHVFFPVFQKKPSLTPFIKWFILLNVLSMCVNVFLDIQDSVLTFSLIVSIIHVYAIILISFLTLPDFWALKISKIVLMTLIGLLVLTIVIGDFYWLIDFVMPIVLSVNTIFYVILVLFNRMRSTDDVYHSGFMSLLGFIPGILLYTPLIQVTIPSQVSVIFSLFALGYILVFHLASLIEGIKRRFHI